MVFEKIGGKCERNKIEMKSGRKEKIEKKRFKINKLFLYTCSGSLVDNFYCMTPLSLLIIKIIISHLKVRNTNQTHI